MAMKHAVEADTQITNTDLAAHFLRDAAAMLRNVAKTNWRHASKMRRTADAYDAVADLVEFDPDAELPKNLRDLMR